jgi:aspartate carbamoyltransferase regulatory subunit
MTEMRRVTAICNGTVIDHVPGGQALRVLRMLRITGSQSNPVSLVMKVPSSKHGSKDIIKVEDRELTQDELDRLALIAPAATVSIIRNFTVAKKRVVELRDEMVNVARCTFSNCITHADREPLPHRLKVLAAEPLELRCHYCGRNQDIEALVENLL